MYATAGSHLLLAPAPPWRGGDSPWPTRSCAASARSPTRTAPPPPATSCARCSLPTACNDGSRWPPRARAPRRRPPGSAASLRAAHTGEQRRVSASTQPGRTVKPALPKPMVGMQAEASPSFGFLRSRARTNTRGPAGRARPYFLKHNDHPA